MLTKKGLDKIGNGALEDFYLKGKLKITVKTTKKKWWDLRKGNLVLEYQLLDLETNELLSNGIWRFSFNFGDSLEIELPDIKKKVELTAS